MENWGARRAAFRPYSPDFLPETLVFTWFLSFGILSSLTHCLLVKSISRFSRNTVDLLSFVRELSDLGVRVFFEKERIDTGELASEFLLSVFAAAAQEEIISLSNNLKVGISSGKRRRSGCSWKKQW